MFGIQHAKTKTFESIDRRSSSVEEIPNVSAKSRAALLAFRLLGDAATSCSSCIFLALADWNPPSAAIE